MSIQPDIYYRNLAARPQQNRQVIVLTLLSKLALVLLLGLAYAGVRLIS
jgi:hypothetical protein